MLVATTDVLNTEVCLRTFRGSCGYVSADEGKSASAPMGHQSANGLQLQRYITPALSGTGVWWIKPSGGGQWYFRGSISIRPRGEGILSGKPHELAPDAFLHIAGPHLPTLAHDVILAMLEPRNKYAGETGTHQNNSNCHKVVPEPMDRRILQVVPKLSRRRP